MKLTKSKPIDDKKVEAIARLMSIGYTMEEALENCETGRSCE